MKSINCTNFYVKKAASGLGFESIAGSEKIVPDPGPTSLKMTNPASFESTKEYVINVMYVIRVHTVKKISDFPFPSGMSLTNPPRPGKLGTGKSLTFFLQCMKNNFKRAAILSRIM
jgi:hypothetical protein